MADIAIPSPSVFLRATPPPPSPPPAAPPSVPKQNGRRRASSAEEKKKAPRKANAGKPLTGGAEASVVKPKQSKSRNGCITCKAKRLKCGEEKPACQQCARRKVVCGGYKKDFKWRPFEETNVKQHLDRQKRGNSPKVASTAVSVDSSKQPSPDANAPPPAAGVESSRDDDATLKRDSVLLEYSPPGLKKSIARPTKAKRPQPRVNSRNGKATVESPHHAKEASSLNQGSKSPEDDLEPRHFPIDLHSGPLPQLSPTLSEMMMLPLDAIERSELQGFHDLHIRGGLQPGNPIAGVIDPLLTNNDISVEDMDDDDSTDNLMPDSTLVLRSRRQSADDMLLPDDAFSGTLNYNLVPYMAEDSPEMLSFRFNQVTCGILSIMDGPHENPWRTLIWPLTHQSPGLYHAISAMTSFHNADVPTLRVAGHEHKAASIRFIKEGIRDNSMGDQTAIATALALGFAESWDQHTSTGNTHIKGAQALVKRALQRHKASPLIGEDLARLKFLCNAWVYMDVIARLTSVESDESQDFDNTFVFSGAPNECPDMVMGDENPGFGIDFGMPVDAKLDPLMGCANTLFPLIGRVANLVRKVCRSQVNSPAVISQANDLKIALEAWDPPAFIERPQDPSTDVQHTLQTAEAYRWATLLHLHSSVPELPSLSSAELAQRVLQYLATVPIASRTLIVQIYPLMVAGCEASSQEDRGWVRDRWHSMFLRMHIGIIEKCATVVEEVWRRRDNYEAQPPSNRKLVATTDLRPSRGRGEPLVRTSTGSLRLGDPGHMGVVFSYVENEDDGNVSDNDEVKKRARDRRNGRDPRMNVMDPAYTVRGHLHWVGVMWDWGWESRLSQ